MAQRRFHYDQAFEQYLRDRTIPYIAVDEAKRALQAGRPPKSLKSFDFVVYSQSGPNLLVDVKGRKHASRPGRSLDNWVTEADVRSLEAWERIFGREFRGAFAFLYWCQREPPGVLFHEVFESAGRWYAVLAITLANYQRYMKRRSPRWGTLSIPADAFAQLAVPLKQLI